MNNECLTFIISRRASAHRIGRGRTDRMDQIEKSQSSLSLCSCRTSGRTLLHPRRDAAHFALGVQRMGGVRGAHTYEHIHIQSDVVRPCRITRANLSLNPFSGGTVAAAAFGENIITGHHSDTSTRDTDITHNNPLCKQTHKSMFVCARVDM